MIYFCIWGVVLLIIVLAVYIITNCNRTLNRKERVKLIIRQVIHFVTLSVILLIIGYLMEQIIKIEDINEYNEWFYMISYLLLSMNTCVGLFYIINIFIRFGKSIFNNNIGDTKTKVFSSRELPEKILVHIEDEESTTENSIETSKTPEDIELVIWGESTVMYNDGRKFVQPIYTCKNKTDEEKLIEIVCKSLHSQAENILNNICNESTTYKKNGCKV